MTRRGPHGGYRMQGFTAPLIASIKAKHGGTDRRIAETIGVAYGTLRDAKDGRTAGTYPLQYALEQLLAWGYPK